MRSKRFGARVRGMAMLLAIFLLAQTVVSLSRSFFLGLAIAGVVTLLCAWREASLRGVGCVIVRTVVVLGATILLIASLCFFPFPRSSSSLLMAWQSRVSASDDASASRWKLLPALWHKIQEHPLIGSGFGATVTYQSRDPRVMQTTGGKDTTYAFEWGWLEHWVKFGIIGIPLMAFLLWSIAQRIWCSSLKIEAKYTLILSLVALAAVHVSTPYLNHPLGFAWLLALEAVIERQRLTTT